MLFYLTKSLIIDESDARFDDVKRAVYNLAIHAAEGYHAVIGDFEVITFFRNVFEKDYRVGSFFNAVYQNFALEVVPSFIKYYVEVVLEVTYSRTEYNKTIVPVCYTRFIPLETTNKTSIVCEFLYDADFFEFVLKWYIKQLAVNVHYAFNKIDGGGANTHKNIEKELNSDHITISIIDKDCRYPGDSVKSDSTCGKCVGIGLDNVLFKLLLLEVHEIENLVPLNFIDEAFPVWTNNDAEYALKKVAFDHLKSDAENILPYFDYKKGIRYNRDYQSSPALQDFAKKCYELNTEKMNIEPDFNRFINTLNENEYIYTELIGGTGTIRMALRLIEEGSAPNPSLFVFQEDNWEKIGQEMLNWCFARNVEAIL